MTRRFGWIVQNALVAGVCLSCFAQQQPEATTTATPTNGELQSLISSMRQYADQYVANLPNFLCVQVTEQFEAGRKAEHWRRGDTLTSKLVFRDGRENRTLELVNDKPIRPGRRWRTPLTTEGEFGLLLNKVFSDRSQAAFRWNRWDTVRGRRVAVIDYAIDAEHSSMRLTANDLARAIVPYHGSIYADPTNGAVWRITDAATDIPREIDTQSISTEIDYDEVAIGSANYVLPVGATVLLATRFNHVRNEIQFQNYRKFEADSTITYGEAH